MALLRTNGLTAFYGDFQALFGVDIVLGAGEVVAVIGANGAGKTTLMRSLAGVVANAAHMVVYDNRPCGDMPAYQMSRSGIAMVPEGRRLFSSLSVEENLLVGAWGMGQRDANWNLDTVYQLFPALRDCCHKPGTSLSGGQQQMVAIGRALMSNPRVLLCDEISLGLAPVVIQDIYAAIPIIRKRGASMLLVEQDITRACAVADRVYCMMEGRVTLEGAPGSLDKDSIHNAYFGVKK